MTDLELAEEIERALNVLQPLARSDTLFSAPNAAPGCELRFSTLRKAIAALRRGPEPSVPEGESLWLIEQTSTVDGKRRFWNGAGYGWDALKAARYPTREAAVEVACNGFNSEVQDVHGRPEICEHLFQCGPQPERPPSGEDKNGN